MIIIRKANERGKTKIDWLNSSHTFSFGEYYDPKFMGFGNLRVINEDIVQPAQGFGTHPHRNMEIISYVVEGSLEHRDSMGTGSVIKPGEIQRMSAGSGVTHSEFNHSKDKLVHFLQIWIFPNQDNLQPSYEQKNIPQIKDKFILIGAKNPTENAVTIHQDVEVYAAYLSAHKTLTYELKATHHAWLQLIKGKIKVNDQLLSAGDGAAISSEKTVEIECIEDAELLFFDLDESGAH